MISAGYIDTDLGTVIRKLDELQSDKERKKMLKGLLSSIGSYARTEVRRAYSGRYGILKRTGNLYKSIDKTLTSNGKAVIISANARKDGKVLYGYAISEGSTVKAKRKEGYLYIPDLGIRLHSYKITQKNFVNEPVMDYLRSARYRERNANYLDRRIAKILEARNDN